MTELATQDKVNGTVKYAANVVDTVEFVTKLITEQCLLVDIHDIFAQEERLAGKEAAIRNLILGKISQKKSGT